MASIFHYTNKIICWALRNCQQLQAWRERCRTPFTNNKRSHFVEMKRDSNNLCLNQIKTNMFLYNKNNEGNQTSIFEFINHEIPNLDKKKCE